VADPKDSHDADDGIGPVNRVQGANHTGAGAGAVIDSHDPKDSRDRGREVRVYGEVFAGRGLKSSLWRRGEVTLELVEDGAGPPLVLLPPLGCEAVVWTPVLQRLARSRRVLACNFPGYGRCPLAGAPDRVEALAGAVAAVLAGAVAGAIDLVGWSLGGFVAQVLAVRAPRQIRSLTLVNTTAHLPLGDSLTEAERLTALLLADLDRDVGPVGAAGPRRWVEWGHDRRTPAVWAHYTRLVTSFDARATAAAIAAPTLIVAGAADRVVTTEQSEWLQRAIAGARLVVLPEVGHYVPLARAAAFAELVEAHVAAGER
jgi:pimeloyl-ACP methyl ester carboxylesterase